MDAMRMTGEWSLIGSGEMTRAGRSPACSDPSTGSSRTRTMSPRQRLGIERTLNLFFQRVVLAFDLEVKLRHVAAAFDNLTPKRFSLPLLDPLAEQFCDHRAPPAGRHYLLEALQCVRRKGIRALQ